MLQREPTVAVINLNTNHSRSIIFVIYIPAVNSYSILYTALKKTNVVDVV